MSAVASFMAFLVTVLFIFVLRPVAQRVALVDVRDVRSLHNGPVPLIGGLAMSGGLAFAGMLMFEQPLWVPLALGIFLLVIVGTIDDRFDLPPTVRLVAQTCAALFVILGANVSVTHLGSPFFFALPLHLVALPFSLLFIVTIINAFNVIDGLDGLAGGLALLALLALGLLGIGTNLLPLIVMLGAAVLGFLIFNLPLHFNRAAHCFMGDAGSTFLGLAVATIGIALSQGSAARFSPVIGLWIIAVPVFDLFCAIIRRSLKGRSPFTSDHDHLHHILNANGQSRRGGALLVILGIAIVYGSIGLAGHYLRVPEGIMMILWFGAGVLYYQIMRRPQFLLRMIKAPPEILARRHPSPAL